MKEDMMEFNLANCLYDIGKKLCHGKDKNRHGLTQDKYKLIKKQLASYNLDKKDITIIAFCWYKAVAEQDTRLSTFEIIEQVFQTKRNCFDRLPVFLSLLNKNILYCEKKQVKKDYQKEEIRIQYDFDSLIDATIGLNKDFFRRVMSLDMGTPHDESAPYQSNDDYLNDWFRYVELRDSCSIYCNLDEQVEDFELIQNQLDLIKKRENKTSEKFPLQEFSADYNLNLDEKAIILYVLREELRDDVCTQHDILNFLSNSALERLANMRFFEDNSKLVRLNILEKNNQPTFLERRETVRLSPIFKYRLVNKKPQSDEELLQQLLLGDSLFELINPQQTFAELVLPADTKNTIKYAVKRYKNNVYNTLASWGIYNPKEKRQKTKSGIEKNPKSNIQHPISKSQKRSSNIQHGRSKVEVTPKLILLFHGVPGTGKTFAAGALARHMEKDLLVTDISRVLDKYVGESEKRLRSIFIRYGEIVKQLENPPILLLNEADQFLGHRMQATRSVDRMYNQMQNLLLEAMENFEGMMILTTNLVGHFDHAFSRRLDLKIRFERPGIPERKRLWKLYLKKEIPGEENINTRYLARNYELTGGQIRMVIENACTEAATRRGKLRLLLTADLEKYIALEQSGQFEKEKQKQPIGFIKTI
jgi:hypothetical protein